MSNNRKKGHDFERSLARFFRELGFKYCKTARQANRMMDDCGIDFVNIPLAVQAKAGYKKNRPKYDELYRESRNRLNINFPPNDPVHDLPFVLIHKIDGRRPENFMWTFQHRDVERFILEYNSIKNELNELKKKYNEE